ncbi:hypothetical protein DAPPUDRAFT_115833 [Daphnia pulex]|uniref:Uncharacterized protein n=1 Tax=Daphnia pulex TaxID=6669 RepID=E9HMP1_DAPPU|nr:hypothetical protein DAPPUDRAFT_115833 [Daphnia pulex]|eukprot:EFX67008.1 hypothetical protein DAPPUDRAFT_115833 [Daphnia pulex]
MPYHIVCQKSSDKPIRICCVYTRPESFPFASRNSSTHSRILQYIVSAFSKKRNEGKLQSGTGGRKWRPPLRYTAALRDFTIGKERHKNGGEKSSETDRKKDYKLPRDIRSSTKEEKNETQGVDGRRVSCALQIRLEPMKMAGRHHWRPDGLASIAGSHNYPSSNTKCSVIRVDTNSFGVFLAAAGTSGAAPHSKWKWAVFAFGPLSDTD